LGTESWVGQTPGIRPFLKGACRRRRKLGKKVGWGVRSVVGKAWELVKGTKGRKQGPNNSQKEAVSSTSTGLVTIRESGTWLLSKNLTQKKGKFP